MLIMAERVNHPPHYNASGIECIDALEAATSGLQGIEAFCTANAIKYLWRWKLKNGEEDLQKAIWYINRLIQRAGADSVAGKELFNMKKYQLGALTVNDKCLQDTKEEIVIELIDRMQKYVAEGKAAYENQSLTTKQKLEQIKRICNYFCGLDEFLQITMDIKVRRADGFLYTQEMYNMFFYWQQVLEIELARESRAAEQ